MTPGEPGFRQSCRDRGCPHRKHGAPKFHAWQQRRKPVAK